MSKKIDKSIPNPEILSNLIDFGLNETEARIYTALLSIGGGSVNNIAEVAGIKRTTTYSTLDSLIKHGLARYDELGFKRKIMPEDPSRLKFLVNEKQVKLEKTLPTLEAMFNLKGGESSIKYYQGIQSIKPLYEQLIKDVLPGNDYYIMFNPKMWFEQDPVFYEDFSIRRSKLPIKIKVILERNIASMEYFKKRKLYNVEARFLPDNVKLETNLVVTPQRILTQQLVHPISALVVENNSFIKMHQMMFKMIWDSLPIESDNL